MKNANEPINPNPDPMLIRIPSGHGNGTVTFSVRENQPNPALDAYLKARVQKESGKSEAIQHIQKKIPASPKASK